MNSPILYEDNHLIAANKLPGEIVQADRSGDRTLADDVKAFIKDTHNKPGNVYLGIIHRLDRPTSGVVLFAKTEKALSRMNALFRRGEVSKFYWAVVQSAPPAHTATLKHYLLRNREKNKSFIADSAAPGAQYAELRYQYVGVSDRYHLLIIEMKTGRHHQIRAQLSEIGCPIKGDLKYGAKRSNPNGGIHLHAREVLFLHPVKRVATKVIAPVPTGPLWQVFEKRALQSDFHF